MATGATVYSILTLIHPPIALLAGIIASAAPLLVYFASQNALNPALIVLTFLPFQDSPILNANLMGVQGMKPLNLLAICAISAAFIQRIALRESFSRHRVVLLAFAAYLTMWTVTFFRSIVNYDIIRNTLGQNERQITDYILSFYIRPTLSALLFIVLIFLAHSYYEMKRVILAIAWSIFLLSLCVFLVVIESNSYMQGRDAASTLFSTYIGLHYNTIGTIYILTTPVLLYAALDGGVLAKTNYTLALIALALTGSRSALIVCALSNLTGLVAMRRLGLALVMSVTISVVVLLGIGPTALALRAIGLQDGGISSLDAIMNSRLTVFWVPLLQEWWENPTKLWFGAGRYGILTSQLSLAGTLMGVEHAHNGVIDFFLDSGLILTVCLAVSLCVGLLWFWRAAYRLGDPLIWCLFLSLAGYLLATLTERGFYPNYDNAHVFPILALLVNRTRLKLAAAHQPLNSKLVLPPLT